MTSMGEKAYNLRAEGYDWGTVGDLLESTAESTRKMAWRWAKANELPWPLKSRRQTTGKGTQQNFDFEAPPGVTDKMVNGERILTANSPMITTYDELIDFCKIDLVDWVIVRREASAWTTPMRDIVKVLRYDEPGKPTGHIKIGRDARFAQNIRLFIAMVPKVPEPIHPVFQPLRLDSVNIFENLAEFPKPKHAKFTRTLVLNDHHFGFRRRIRDAQLFPFHDRRALDLCVQIAERIKPDRIELLGDWFDLTEWTDRYLRSPEFYFTLQPALLESYWWLVQLRALCDDIRFHEGNHEIRLRNAIKRYLPFAYGLRPAYEDTITAPAVLSLRNLMGLDQLGIELVRDYPNDRDWLAPGLAVRHGDITRRDPGMQTRAMAKRGHVSEINGHGHKREMHTGVRDDYHGWVEYETWMFGCLCKTDLSVPGHKISQEWSKGLGVVDVFENGDFDIQTVKILEDRATHAGELYIARDRLEELRTVYMDEGVW